MQAPGCVLRVEARGLAAGIDLSAGAQVRQDLRCRSHHYGGPAVDELLAGKAEGAFECGIGVTDDAIHESAALIMEHLHYAVGFRDPVERHMAVCWIDRHWLTGSLSLCQ